MSDALADGSELQPMLAAKVLVFRQVVLKAKDSILGRSPKTSAGAGDPDQCRPGPPGRRSLCRHTSLKMPTRSPGYRHWRLPWHPERKA
nr:hypothetical protein CFP56_72799 [Quercus suber]